MKGFPEVHQLASIAFHGAPVHVNDFGGADITAALTYNNHSRVIPYTADIIINFHKDVRFGRAFVFPLRLVNHVMGLMLSPLAVVASTSKTRVKHGLAFTSSPSSPAVNADTDGPPRQLGHLLAARGSMKRFIFYTDLRCWCANKFPVKWMSKTHFDKWRWSGSSRRRLDTCLSGAPGTGGSIDDINRCFARYYVDDCPVVELQ